MMSTENSKTAFQSKNEEHFLCWNKESLHMTYTIMLTCLTLKKKWCNSEVIIIAVARGSLMQQNVY